MSATEAAKAEDALRAQRDAFLEDLTGPMKKAVATSMAKAPALWIEAFGSLNAKANDPKKLEGILTALRADLPDVPKRLAPQVTKAISEAQALSARHAVTVIPARVATPKLAISKASETAVKDLVTKSAKLLKLADLAMGQLDTKSNYSDLTTSLSLASQSANSIDAGATYAMATGATDAVSQVADAAGVGTVIVGERDACLDCNGYQGQTSEDTDDLPPFHPHCLCVTQPWSPSWVDKGEVGFPDALKREAQRSIARGSSAHDSNAARVRAADALLTKGTTLPASVKTVARRAIKSGQF